ncbi:hypothetical protein OAO17_00530 [Candidatus Pelagibacter sp.]|nr:hypothetical protein [Candidatus Pelagibacter sp.]
MKKITFAILILLGTFSISSAEMGINVGISGNTSVFQATGEETTTDALASVPGNSADDKNSEDATAVVGYTSFFIEKTLGFLPGPLGNLSLGYDYVSETMTSDQVENNRLDNNIGGAATVVENTVKVAFEDLTTIYLTANITDNLYAKYGWVDVDVITKESLATGSEYPNTDLSGTTYGLGYNKTFGSNFFIRGEAMYMDLGGATLTSTTNAENSVKIKDLTGATARFSVGKSF